MIDEEKTYVAYGYYSTDLSHGSGKPVIMICEWCNVAYSGRRDGADKRRFCSVSCYGKWQSENLTGENNPRWSGGEIVVVCDWCGNTFESYPSKERRFCSQDCYAKSLSGKICGEDNPNWSGGENVHICVVCGKAYNRPNSQSHRTKCCSVECRLVYTALANRGERVDRIDKSCAHCGNHFVVLPSQVDVIKFCSQECRKEYMSINYSGEDSHRWAGGQILKICDFCGAEYYVAKCREHTAMFCSVECMGKGTSGENSIFWMGGISFEPYCEKFNNHFKEGIREKFDRKCFLCNKDEERNGQKLAVHHVSYLKDCLCGEVKCDFVPLCKVCHGKTNANRPFWERLFTYALQYHDSYHNVKIPKPLLRLNI